MIGLVGAKGSGKTVLMTVLVKQLRDGRREGGSGRISRLATDNPDGHQGLSDYQANREQPLYNGRHAASRDGPAAAIPAACPRWCCAGGRSPGDGWAALSLHSTVLSFVDTAGEDLNDLGTAFTLQYLSVCGALIDHARPVRAARRAGPAEPAGRGDRSR